MKLTRPPIVGFNKDIGWVCNICKEIPSKENGNLTKRRYKRMKTTWEIKDDLKWSDGTPVTNKDVAYTVSQLDHRYFNLKIDEQDSKKFKIEFRSSHYDFYQMLNFSLLPFHKFKKLKNSSVNAQKFIEEGYAYGPYRVSVIDNDSITLSRNNYYTKKAKVETIKFSEFNSKSKRLLDQPL